MLIPFFDSKGVMHKEFVPEGRMVTEEFYLEVLGRLLKWIAHMRPEAWKNCSFNFLHNDVPARTITTVQQFLPKKKGSSA